MIEEFIDALIVGGGVGVRMCERSLSRARAKAQTDGFQGASSWLGVGPFSALARRGD